MTEINSKKICKISEIHSYVDGITILSIFWTLPKNKC